MKGKYQIAVYGKEGCDKCVALKERIGKMLQNQEYRDFSLKYYDLTTIEGLVAYAKAETVNGQRIPSLQIMKYNQDRQNYSKIKDRRKEKLINNRLFYPTYLQLETDYSDPQRAVIKPKDIKELLSLAKDN
jgi:hypothetical protein